MRALHGGGANTTCAVAIHTALGNRIQPDGIGFVVAWHQNLTRALGTALNRLRDRSHGAEAAVEAAPPAPSFDLIGLSMYPKYDGGDTLRNVVALGALARAFPRRRCVVLVR